MDGASTGPRRTSIRIPSRPHERGRGREHEREREQVRRLRVNVMEGETPRNVRARLNGANYPDVIEVIGTGTDTDTGTNESERVVGPFIHGVLAAYGSGHTNNLWALLLRRLTCPGASSVWTTVGASPVSVGELLLEDVVVHNVFYEQGEHEEDRGGASGLSQFMASILGASLRSFTLRGVTFKEDGADVALEYAPVSTPAAALFSLFPLALPVLALTYLELSHGTLDSPCAPRLLRSVLPRTPSLRYLNVSYNHRFVANDGLAVLTDAVSASTLGVPLQEIRAAAIGIKTSEHVTALTAVLSALSHPHVLRELDVSLNTIFIVDDLQRTVPLVALIKSRYSPSMVLTVSRCVPDHPHVASLRNHGLVVETLLLAPRLHPHPPPAGAGADAGADVGGDEPSERHQGLLRFVHDESRGWAARRLPPPRSVDLDAVDALVASAVSVRGDSADFVEQIRTRTPPAVHIDFSRGNASLTLSRLLAVYERNDASLQDLGLRGGGGTALSCTLWTVTEPLERICLEHIRLTGATSTAAAAFRAAMCTSAPTCLHTLILSDVSFDETRGSRFNGESAATAGLLSFFPAVIRVFPLVRLELRDGTLDGPGRCLPHVLGHILGRTPFLKVLDVSRNPSFTTLGGLDGLVRGLDGRLISVPLVDLRLAAIGIGTGTGDRAASIMALVTLLELVGRKSATTLTYLDLSGNGLPPFVSDVGGCYSAPSPDLALAIALRTLRSVTNVNMEIVL